MTPEERANKVYELIGGMNTADKNKLLIADAIREAVAAEREACATIALESRAVPETANNQFFRERSKIAADIRARGEKGRQE